jgi:hypothetical protein
VSVVFEVVEERGDEGGVEVGQVQGAGRLAGAGLSEADQQPEGVAVGGDGVRAGLSLVAESLEEEALQGRGERAHRGPPWATTS